MERGLKRGPPGLKYRSFPMADLLVIQTVVAPWALVVGLMPSIAVTSC